MVFDTLRRDLRIGLRVLVREKSFCALAVLVLALGISTVTTMFSVVNGVMLRGFSFPNASRLASVNFIDPTTRTAFGVNGQVSSMDLEELQPLQQSFELMAGFLNGSTVNLTVNGQPRRYTGTYATDSFLRVLGVAPLMGRDFTPADNRPGAEKVALIAYGLWQRDFGGAPDIVGREVRLNGKAATIIGVMPKGFTFPTNEELWIPLYSEFPPKPRNDPSANAPGVIGLLKPGLSWDQANAEFSGFARRFAQAYPETNKHFDVAEVKPLIETFTPLMLRATLLTMLGFCVGVLLIACVNVMNMQFARATLRARELAIRSTLGATRGRLILQMLTESALLAVMGAVIGVGLAYVASDWLSATLHNMDNPPPAWMTFDIDGPVLAFTVVATVGAALLSGLLPAWMASRGEASEALKDGGRGHTSARLTFLSRSLVVAQIVVTCILLIGSLLQLRSILKQQTIDYGYDIHGVMSARMGLMDGDYPTAAARQQFYDRLVRDLQAAPEFESVALTNRFRMVFSGNGPIELEGQQYKDEKDRPTANFEQVTGGYFGVTGQKLLEGRALRDDDGDGKLPVAVVNAAFARKHFGTGSAVGRRFRSVDPGTRQPGPWRQIVGVASTVRMMGPFNNPGVDDTGYYVPFYANPTGPVTAEPFVSQFATLVVRPRSQARAETAIPALRREMARADANLPLYFVGTPASQIDVFVAQNRIVALMFTTFGLVAIVLASVGIYGVTSFSVNQRTQEFGVRMALGADSRRILAMVLRQGAWQVGIGLGIGLSLALAVATLAGSGIQRTLFDVGARDPLTYGSVFILIAGVALLATLVPATRATRVDPMVALKAE